MLQIVRYAIKSERLKPWVKFIWYLETVSNVSLNHKLLPTDSIDVIINLSDKIDYQIEKKGIVPVLFILMECATNRVLLSKQGK